MRFIDDNDRFGLLVSPIPGQRRIFRFQLIIRGQLVGDREGSIIGSVMQGLKDQQHIDDERLDLLDTDPAAFMELFAVDQFLHDSTMMSAESLDGWATYSYVRAGRFVVVAQEYVGWEEVVGAYGEVVSLKTGPILVANIDAAEFDSIVDAARSYWRKHQ